MDGLVLRFPTNVEMDVTTQEYQRDASKLKGQQILPMKLVQSQKVEWDEKDNVVGMTAVHTMDTDPKVRGRRGSNLKSYEPIPHKETELIKESELLKARSFGTLGGVINIDDLVMGAFSDAMSLDDVRIEWEIWQALQGQLNIDENGVVLSETFPIQEYTPDVPWDERADAFVLRDLNAIAQLFTPVGASAQGSIAHLNQATFNKILENTNPLDLRGFNVDNFRSAAFDLGQFNKLLEARKLPIFDVYDEGFHDDLGVFRRFIANGKVVIEGKRPPGQRIGDYVSTPSLHRVVNGQPAPGRFAFITVNGQANDLGMVAGVSLQQVGSVGNPNIGIVHGVYGGPRLVYPRTVVKVNAFEE
jgi:major capsid protein E